MRRVEGFPLWIGTARDARDLRLVLDAEIEAIVDLAMEEPPVHPTRELVYLRFPITDDGENSELRLRMAMRAIEELVGDMVPTLVACSAGMSRSPALVAVVISQFKGISPEESLIEIRATGPTDVSPSLWQSLVPLYLSQTRK
jgi:protein-tyrosine phosphatase